MLKTNYHTHSLFCDGKGSPEEIVQAAIKADFNILGFSSHSMFPFAGDCHIPYHQHQDYVNAVRSAAEKYKDKITVLCGFEAEYIPLFADSTLTNYKSLNPDYLIGSVHYIFTENGHLGVDYKADELKIMIDDYYKGDAKKMVQDYFLMERKMLEKGDFTIIGHPDLVRLNNNKLGMFDENDSWYRSEITATADAIKKAGVIAEINTGAIARGRMTDIYPSAEFLELLFQRGVPVTINSDCHNPDFLDCAFDKALQAAVKAGYKELAYLDADAKVKFQKIQ